MMDTSVSLLSPQSHYTPTLILVQLILFGYLLLKSKYMRYAQLSHNHVEHQIQDEADIGKTGWRGRVLEQISKMN